MEERRIGISWLIPLLSLAYSFYIYRFSSFTALGDVLFAITVMISVLAVPFLLRNEERYAVYLVYLLVGFNSFISSLVSLPKDENAIRYGAVAYLLHGHDPYSAQGLMASFPYHVPIGLRTLTLYGGFVDRLIYPGFSVIACVPSYFLGYNVFDALLNVGVVVLSFLTVMKAFRTSKEKGVITSISFMVVWILFGGADVSTLMLILSSFFPRYRGFFVGLAVSFNQLYVLVVPFMVLYLGRDAFKQLGLGVGSFLLTNLPFILMSPSSWFHAMLFSASQPIVPLGFSLSRLTYLGLSDIPYYIYEKVFLLMYALSILTYFLGFRYLKEFFYLMPIVSMLFYPRALEGYFLS